MFIFDQINAREYSNVFTAEMDEAYFSAFPVGFNSDALLGYFYFM